MKLHELKLLETDNDFDTQNELDRRASPIKIPSIYDKHDYGKKTIPKLVKVLVKDTKMGKIYGARALYQKEV